MGNIFQVLRSLHTCTEHFQPPIRSGGALVEADQDTQPAALLQAVLDPQGKKPCRFFLLGQSPSSNLLYVEIADLFCSNSATGCAEQEDLCCKGEVRCLPYLCLVFLLGFP